jgi:hypothetical protein
MGDKLCKIVPKAHKPLKFFLGPWRFHCSDGFEVLGMKLHSLVGDKMPQESD